MAVYEQIKRSQFTLLLMGINIRYGFRCRPVIDKSENLPLKSYKPLRGMMIKLFLN